MGGSAEPAWSGYTNQLFADKTPQTIAMPDSEEKGASPIYRVPAAKDGFQLFLKSDDEKTELSSGWAVSKMALNKYADRKCYGYRPFNHPDTNLKQRGAYKFDTYATVAEQIYATGNGLASLGLDAQSNIGIFSINRSEWMITHLANWSQSYRTVALYDTLGADAVQYIVWHAEVSVIFVEKDKLPALFEAISSCAKDKELNLKYIVQFDYQEKYNNKHEAVDEQDVAKAKEFGLELMGLTQLMEKGADKKDEQEPAADDLSYIMYTSGTTGNPKGVMLTHRCFACTVASSLRTLESNGLKMSSEDCHVSYLPLAHSFEANVIMFCMAAGAGVAFWAGDIKTISRDWTEIRPTVVFGVPRIFNKTYDKVKLTAKQSGGMKEWMFNKGEESSQQAIRQGKRSSFYDSVVWKKVGDKIGFDRAKIIASGAAPLPPHVAEFLRIVYPQAAIVQGYGLTESCAVSFFTSMKDQNLGHVGVPVDNIEYRLVDAPECGYLASDQPNPRGEVQLRGPTIMNGYFKNEEATKKALDENGWFSTGDIGRVNPNGTLSIIDRRKNMFKTAMGEYIAAENLENAYVKAPPVNQLWIYGNSFKSFVVAVVVPDPLWLVPHLKEKGLWADEQLTPATQEYCDKFKKVCEANYDVVKKLVVDNIKPTEAEAGLKKFEQIKDYHVECEVDNLLQGFNVDNETLTPTFKLKRPQLLRRYKEVVKELYAKNGEEAKDEENW